MNDTTSSQLASCIFCITNQFTLNWWSFVKWQTPIIWIDLGTICKLLFSLFYVSINKVRQRYN